MASKSDLRDSSRIPTQLVNEWSTILSLNVWQRGRMLDPPTTLFTTVLATATCGVLLLTCCGRGRNRPLLVWAVAMIVAACGLVVVAGEDAHGGLLESAGTAILLLASGLFWTATRVFRGAPVRWVVVVAGPAVWISTTPLQTESSWWTAAACFLGTLYTAASFRELLFTRDEQLPSWPSAVALTFAHAAIYLSRTLMAVGEVIAPDWVQSPPWIAIALVLEAMIHIIGSAIVLVALSLERQDSRTNSNLQIAAYQDGLTGIGNRRSFDERLDELADDRRQNAGIIGLMMLDLDRFKSINDTLGHSEGDRILRTVANIIATNVRPGSDMAARYGGEEFAVIVTQATSADVRRTAERIRAAVETAAIPNPGTGGVITVSIGLGVINGSELKARRHEFLAETDAALYEAKRLGRNRVVFAAAPVAHLRLRTPRPHVRAA